MKKKLKKYDTKTCTQLEKIQKAQSQSLAAVVERHDLFNN